MSTVLQFTSACERRKVLREIKILASQKMQGRADPRDILSLLLAAAIGLIALNISTLFCLIALISTYCVFQCFSPWPMTIEDRLAKELIAYDPINKDAYRELQNHVSENGCFDPEVILAWICEEQKAIGFERARLTSAQTAFVSK